MTQDDLVTLTGTFGELKELRRWFRGHEDEATEGVKAEIVASLESRLLALLIHWADTCEPGDVG